MKHLVLVCFITVFTSCKKAEVQPTVIAGVYVGATEVVTDGMSTYWEADTLTITKKAGTNNTYLLTKSSWNVNAINVILDGAGNLVPDVNPSYIKQFRVDGDNVFYDRESYWSANAIYYVTRRNFQGVRQ